jgi:hypothetical protein
MEADRQGVHAGGVSQMSAIRLKLDKDTVATLRCAAYHRASTHADNVVMFVQKGNATAAGLAATLAYRNTRAWADLRSAMMHAKEI